MQVTLVIDASAQQLIVDEFGSVIGIDTEDRNGKSIRPSAGLEDHFWALLRTDPFTIHRVAISVTIKVKQNSTAVPALVADHADLHAAMNRVGIWGLQHDAG